MCSGMYGCQGAGQVGQVCRPGRGSSGDEVDVVERDKIMTDSPVVEGCFQGAIGLLPRDQSILEKQDLMALQKAKNLA